MISADEGASASAEGGEGKAGRASAPPHTVAIFGHGVAIKCALRRMLKWSPSQTHRLHMANTSITEVHYSPKPGGKGGWFVRRVNDHAHIEGV